MSRSTPTPAQARMRAIHPGVGLGQGVAVVALGGGLGAMARWGLSSALPSASGHLPWTTLLINVVGSGLLAALPLLPAARRRAWAGLLVGTGMLGGFTTMSTASVDTFTLLDEHHAALALVYCLGTVGAALTAVLLVDRLSTLADRAEAESAGWDE